MAKKKPARKTTQKTAKKTTTKKVTKKKTSKKATKKTTKKVAKKVRKKKKIHEISTLDDLLKIVNKAQMGKREYVIAFEDVDFKLTAENVLKDAAVVYENTTYYKRDIIKIKSKETVLEEKDEFDMNNLWDITNTDEYNLYDEKPEEGQIF